MRRSFVHATLISNLVIKKYDEKTSTINIFIRPILVLSKYCVCTIATEANTSRTKRYTALNRRTVSTDGRPLSRFILSFYEKPDRRLFPLWGLVEEYGIVRPTFPGYDDAR